MIQLPVSYYTKLLTSEYANNPKLQAMIAVLAQPYVDAISCLESFDEAFDLDLAVGAQLDIIGEIIGVGRILPFQLSNSLDSTLGDDDYRTLLKATIGLNFWKGGLWELDGLWKFLYPTGQIIVMDNQDMTMSVYLGGTFTSLVIDMILNDMIVPRPQAVLVNFYLGNYPLFGFDTNNSYIAGFDKGNWFSPTYAAGV